MSIETIYIDSSRGVDTGSDGSKPSKPLATLEYFFNTFATVGKDYNVILSNGVFEITTSTIFNKFNNATIRVIGKGANTEVILKTGINSNTNRGYSTFTLEFDRMKFNILQTLTSANLLGFNWNWNFRNVLFEYTPNNDYSVFSSNSATGGMIIKNCVKLTNTTNFLRKNNSTISIVDSGGLFTTGYATAIGQIDGGGNRFEDVSDNYMRILNSGDYAWEEIKSFVSHSGKFWRFKERYAGQSSSTNLVPIMTSNNTPSGLVTCGGQANTTTYAGFNAFNNINSSGWSSGWYTNGGASTCWLQYEFFEPVEIHKISLISGSISSGHYGIKNFTVSGSNDGISYVDLVISVHPNDTTEQFYDVLNPKEYKMYRIKGDSHYGTSHMYINRFKMFGADIPLEYEKWQEVGTTLPSQEMFEQKGMDIESVLARRLTDLIPKKMSRVENLSSTDFQVYSKKLNLKKLFDIERIYTN